MRKINLICSLILMVIAIAFFLYSFTFPTIADEDVGAALMPQIYSALLFFLAILLLFKTIWQKGTEDNLNTGQNLKIVFLTMSFIVIYVIIIPIVGFYVSTLLFAFSFLWFTGNRRPLILTSIPISIALFIFLTFQKILFVALPTGIFF